MESSREGIRKGSVPLGFQSLSGFKDGSRGGVVDVSMKAKTVLEDSLIGKFHERS